MPLFRSALYRALAHQRLTHGIDAHEYGAIAFFKMFPDQHLVNNPYKIMPAQREWTFAKGAADELADLIGGTGTLSNRRRTWFLAAWPLKLGMGLSGSVFGAVGIAAVGAGQLNIDVS